MSKGASRVGQDKAEGIILGPGADRVFVEGKKWSLDQDEVTPHSPSHGPNPPVRMIASSTRVVVQGKKPVREGDKATCDHVATGSNRVFAG
jgi:uncharacterized Zn-binding protein involved in type VI secretion